MDSILIIGTREIAATLGIGRNRLLRWLNDPEMGLPVSNQIIPGRWVATRQNLVEWSNAYFYIGPDPAHGQMAGAKPSKAARVGPDIR